MKHLFVPYEIALLLKQKGFDEPCLARYIDKKLYIALMGNPYTSGLENIDAPLYQQVVDWFREEHKIWIEVCPMGDLDSWKGLVHTTYGIANIGSRVFKTFYEAITEAINHAITLLP